MAKRGHWHLYSTREQGQFSAPFERISRLPKGAEVSADGNWAELRDEKGVARVFIKLEGEPAASAAKRRDAA